MVITGMETLNCPVLELTETGIPPVDPAYPEVGAPFALPCACSTAPSEAEQEEAHLQTGST